MSKSIGTRASALRRVATILLLATITNGAEIDIETDKLIRHRFWAARMHWALCRMNMLVHNMDSAEAVKSYRKVAPFGEVDVLNSLAWTLATSGNPTICDGSNTVVFAEKAVAATNRKNQAVMDTLATACAEAGQFEKAITAEQEAIALLQTEAEKSDYGAHVKLFEAKAPCRAKD